MRRLTVMLALMAWFPVITRADEQQAHAELRLTEVADSQSYLVYHYELSTPAESPWATTIVRLDISTSVGAPGYLPATGDIETIAPFDRETPHADVGPITPAGWRAIISPIARLSWAPPVTRSVSGDSIPAGTSRVGYGLRSTYLPGVTRMEALPPTEACCLLPADTTGGERIYRSPSDFAGSSLTVAPKFHPDTPPDVVLASELPIICSETAWIMSDTLCNDLASIVASQSLASDGNLAERLRTTVVQSWQAGLITSNAYWLLLSHADRLPR